MSYLKTAVICLPQDVNREEFVNDCLLRGTVWLFSPKTGVIPNVRVGMSCINSIRFPTTFDEFGSEVVYERLNGSNEFLIIEVLKDANDANNKREDSDSIGGDKSNVACDMKNGVISTYGVKGKHTRVGIGAVDDLDVPNGGITRTSKTHLINVLSSFLVMVMKSKTEKLTFELTPDGLTYLDINNNKINITADKLELIGDKLVSVGDASEVALLGNATKGLLSDFIDQVASITVTTAIGVMPIMNAAQVTALKKSLDGLLSTYFKIQ